MADFFRHYHQSTMACCCRWNRRCSPGKGNAVSHRKVSLTSELHVIQEELCDQKKTWG